MKYLDCGCAFTEGGTRTWCPTCMDTTRRDNKRISQLESQLREMEQMRDEAGRRYVQAVGDLHEAQSQIGKMREIMRGAIPTDAPILAMLGFHRDDDCANRWHDASGKEIAHLRECLKRLEWCNKWGTESPDDCCPACSGLRPREDNGYSHLADIGHDPDCWLAAALKEGE